MTTPQIVKVMVASFAVAALSLIALSGCAAPGSAGPSATTCAEQLTACGTFTSTNGIDDGMDVPWLKTKPLELTFTTMNGSNAIVMKTPCNTVTVPVSTDVTTLTPDVQGISATAKGCLDEAGTQEAWATRFASQKLHYMLTQGKLSLSANNARIDLRS